MPLRTPAIAQPAWKRVDDPPAELRTALIDHPGVALWMAAAPVAPAAGSPPPVPIHQGRPFAPWSPEAEPFAGLVAWWDEERDILLALSPDPPEKVSLDLAVDAAAELGRWERGGLVGARGRPAAEHLLDRFTLGEVSGPGLLLPAPGVLTWPVARLQAQRLELTVSLADVAWRRIPSGLQRAHGQSDGARVAVEIAPAREGAVPERLWSTELAAGGAGTDVSIDLSARRGSEVVLRLVSEPGPGGDPSFDYVVWSDLRLRGGDPDPPSRPHVVLIDVDTLRADRLGRTGPGGPLTPRTDAWAGAHATVHTDATATSSWTLPSTVSMLTGLAVHQHGIDRSGEGLAAETATLASLLRAAGYETRAWVGGGYLRPTFGFDAGFDRYTVRAPKDIDWSEALRFVRQRDGEHPLFLFLHTYFVHAPYPHDPRFVDPDYTGPLAGRDVDIEAVLAAERRGELVLDEDDRRYIAALYDGLVARLDDSLGALLEELETLLAPEGLLVVLTSDHGEAFGEHGLFGHGQVLYEELVQVPLVVRFPHGRPAVRSGPVSLLDLVPTVLDVVGLPRPDGLAGRSLVTEPEGPTVRVAEFEGRQRAVASDGLKLIEHRPAADGRPDRFELYDLRRDGSEQNDLGPTRPQDVDALLRRLEWFVGAHPPPEGAGPTEHALGAAEAAELRALGYLGGDR